jgi:hypothetical protein
MTWTYTETRGGMAYWENENGDQLYYGDFGPDTYGLYTTIDGKDCTMRVCAEHVDEATFNAERLLEKLASGWRPINWEQSTVED